MVERPDGLQRNISNRISPQTRPAIEPQAKSSGKTSSLHTLPSHWSRQSSHVNRCSPPSSVGIHVSPPRTYRRDSRVSWRREFLATKETQANSWLHYTRGIGPWLETSGKHGTIGHSKRAVRHQFMTIVEAVKAFAQQRSRPTAERRGCLEE